jgi:hypothetical protein
VPEGAVLSIAGDSAAPPRCRRMQPPPPPLTRSSGEQRHWKQGEVIVFDDSFEHEVWHNGTRSAAACAAYGSAAACAAYGSAAACAAYGRVCESSHATCSPRIVMIIDFWHPDMSEVHYSVQSFSQSQRRSFFFGGDFRLSIGSRCTQATAAHTHAARHSASLQWGLISLACARAPPPPDLPRLCRQRALHLFMSNWLLFSLPAFSSIFLFRYNALKQGKVMEINDKCVRRSPGAACLPPCLVFLFLMLREQIRAHRRRGDA